MLIGQPLDCQVFNFKITEVALGKISSSLDGEIGAAPLVFVVIVSPVKSIELLNDKQKC